MTEEQKAELREATAAMVLAGLSANPDHAGSPDIYAAIAVARADALIKALEDRKFG